MTIARNLANSIELQIGSMVLPTNDNNPKAMNASNKFVCAKANVNKLGIQKCYFIIKQNQKVNVEIFRKEK